MGRGLPVLSRGAPRNLEMMRGVPTPLREMLTTSGFMHGQDLPEILRLSGIEVSDLGAFVSDLDRVDLIGEGLADASGVADDLMAAIHAGEESLAGGPYFRIPDFSAAVDERRAKIASLGDATFGAQCSRITWGAIEATVSGGGSGAVHSFAGGEPLIVAASSVHVSTLAAANRISWYSGSLLDGLEGIERIRRFYQLQQTAVRDLAASHNLSSPEELAELALEDPEIQAALSNWFVDVVEIDLGSMLTGALEGRLPPELERDVLEVDPELLRGVDPSLVEMQHDLRFRLGTFTLPEGRGRIEDRQGSARIEAGVEELLGLSLSDARIAQLAEQYFVAERYGDPQLVERWFANYTQFLEEVWAIGPAPTDDDQYALYPHSPRPALQCKAYQFGGDAYIARQIYETLFEAGQQITVVEAYSGGALGAAFGLRDQEYLSLERGFVAELPEGLLQRLGLRNYAGIMLDGLQLGELGLGIEARAFEVAERERRILEIVLPRFRSLEQDLEDFSTDLAISGEPVADLFLVFRWNSALREAEPVLKPGGYYVEVVPVNMDGLELDVGAGVSALSPAEQMEYLPELSNRLTLAINPGRVLFEVKVFRKKDEDPGVEGFDGAIDGFVAKTSSLSIDVSDEK